MSRIMTSCPNCSVAKVPTHNTIGEMQQSLKCCQCGRIWTRKNFVENHSELMPPELAKEYRKGF